LWRAPADVNSPRIEGNANGIFSTIYLSDTFALRPQDGRAAWKGAAPGWVIAATDRMVLAVGPLDDGGASHPLALDAAGGHVLWRSPADFGAIGVTYDIVPISGDFIYGSHGSEVVAVRAADGAQAWRARLDSRVVYGVVATGGVVFIASGRSG